MFDDGVYFGYVGKPLPDWRQDDLDDYEVDDALLDETPPDVIGVLGFDPLEEDE